MTVIFGDIVLTSRNSSAGTSGTLLSFVRRVRLQLEVPYKRMAYFDSDKDPSATQIPEPRAAREVRFYD